MGTQPSIEDQFLTKVHQVIKDNLDNENFSVEDLANSVGLSRSMLHRKLIKLTGKSASEHITRSRLLNAKSILEDNSATVSETAYKVGFKSPSYFNKVFKKYFNVSPGDVKKGMITDRTVSLIDSDPKVSKLDYSKKLFAKQEILIISFIILCITIGVYLWVSLSEPNQKSIAVLPFKNLSEDVTNQYFVDGMMEELLINLSGIEGLKVISRTSSEKYRGSDKSVSQIAKELRVSHVIEGSVQKSENNVKIFVQLIDAQRDQHLWSESFTREFVEIFNVQSEIARQVATELNTVLSPEEKEEIEKTYTKNMEAYSLYLKGRYFWHRRTEQDVKKSIEYFNQALIQDSNYSLAYAGLADAYHILAFYGWYSWVEGWEKSKEYANIALSINSNLAEAHATLGCIATWYDWNWEKAEQELKMAIKLRPSYASAYQYYSEYQRVLGNYEDAIRQIDIAIELNPNSLIMYHIRSLYYYHTGEYSRALRDGEKVFEIEKQNILQLWLNFKIHIRQGSEVEAVTELQKLIYIKEPDLNSEKLLGNIYANKGIEGIVEWVIHRQVTENYFNYSNAVIDNRFIAELFSLNNEWDSVMVYLRRYVESDIVRPDWFRYSADFKKLENDPGFMALLKEIGLDEL
ncbi:helix-turn-helix domain-containing protein [Labilibacter sediminis]|nr:helix-turn-helix domain-containing protein [Labilibacter sediminis]